MKTDPCHTDFPSFPFATLRAIADRAVEGWLGQVECGANGDDGIDAGESVPGNASRQFALAQYMLFSRI